MLSCPHGQRTYVHFLDDFDGTELGDGDGETVYFALDGTSYEIDLSDDNAASLRESLSSYIGAGRKVSNGRRATKKTAAARFGPATAEIRAWGTENGHDVPARGRVPREVRDAYASAN